MLVVVVFVGGSRACKAAREGETEGVFELAAVDCATRVTFCMAMLAQQEAVRLPPRARC